MSKKMITVEEFAENLDRFRIPLSSMEREKRKGNIPYYGAAKVIDYVDDFTHSGLAVLIAEDGSVETSDGYPVLQLADGKYWVNNHTHVLKGIDDYETKYLYYALHTIKVAPFVTGAVQKKISQKALNSMSFPYFDDKQVRENIVDILLAFDKKIQLNTQINQTLEQIAQAIFKSWFIDFDPVKAKAEAKAQGATDEQANIAAMSVISGKSPDQLNAYKQTHPTDYQQLHQLAQAFPSELEEIDGVEVPKGWGIEKLDDLFDVGIGKTPPRKEPEWFTEDPQNIEWISIKDMGNQGTFITNSSEYLTKEAIEKFNIRLIPENTTILSFKLTLGRVSITTKETTTNEAIAHFKVKKDTGLSSEFLYLYLKQFNFDSLGSSSSIATAINSKTIKNIPIIYPNRSVLAIFNKRIRGLFNEMRNLTENSNELAKCRDLLLPKLLSGELGV